MPAVSVVVPTRNSAQTLEACLHSIRAQSAESVELIVVDNHSSDSTPQIAGQLAAEVVTEGPERSRQRNIGARLASGRWLMFVDSDMVLPPDVISECLTASEHATAVIVPEVSVGSGFWSACKALERSCYVGDDTIEAPRFIDRNFFLQIGGFDEDLTGPEDWDLANRIRETGAPTRRTSTPIVHDEGRLTLLGTMRSKYYYGRTFRRYIRKHPSAARSQMTLLRPAYARNLQRLARQPLLAAGMMFMKSCEIVAGGVGALAPAK